jgi:hypothetical protein
MIHHGGNIWGKDVLDFSANISPFLLPAIKEAVRASADMINVYPDPYCTALAESIGRYEGVPADRIVCGNGAADLIYRIVRAISPKKAVIMQPTFTEYEKALSEQPCTIDMVPMTDERMAEHGCVRLPKDADGEVWNVGDFAVGEVNPNNPQEVERMIWYGLDSGWQLETDHSIFPCPEKAHHHKPPTVEDVLREFAQECLTYATNVDDHEVVDAIEKYAERLQLKESE